MSVGVVFAVCDARQSTELFSVELRKSSGQTLCGSGKHAIVMLILFAELTHTITHISNDSQAQLLSLLALAVMFSDKSHQTFCQPDEANTEGTLVDDRSYRIIGSQLVSPIPQHTHHKRELLLESRLLEFEALMQLGSNRQQSPKSGLSVTW